MTHIGSLGRTRGPKANICRRSQSAADRNAPHLACLSHWLTATHFSECVGVVVCVCVSHSLFFFSFLVYCWMPGGPIELAIITRHGKWLLKVYFATVRPLIMNDALRTPPRAGPKDDNSCWRGRRIGMKLGNCHYLWPSAVGGRQWNRAASPTTATAV